MSIASGFSIQRNDVINVPHRAQTETHTAYAGEEQVYVLRSKPDYANDEWDWDIRIGEIRLHLNRKLGAQTSGTSPVNAFNTGAGGVGTQAGAVSVTNDEAWESNLYSEGSVDAGFGSVKYRSDIGQFGAIEFSGVSSPMPGEKIKIKYTEHIDKWTSNDGGLLYQLAHDMCIHPFEGPELFQASFGGYREVDSTQTGAVGDPIESDFTTTPAATPAAVKIFKNPLSASYVDMYTDSGYAAEQRTANAMWKIVRNHSETAVLNLSASSTDVVYNQTTYNTDASDASPNVLNGQYSLAALQGNGDIAPVTAYIPLMVDFPFVESDLGTGTFKVVVGGRTLTSDDWVVTSTPAQLLQRKSVFWLKRTDLMPWIPNPAAVDIQIVYTWAKSINVPFGALVGPNGLGPDQTAAGANSTDLAFPHKDPVDASDLWFYSRPFRGNLTAGSGAAPTNAFMGFATATSTSQPNIALKQGSTSAEVTTGIGLGAIADTSPRHRNIAKINEKDLMLLQMAPNDEYMTPFRLIYPSHGMSASGNSDIDLKIALKKITNRFLVESEKGCDLLSDSNVTIFNNSPASTRKAQNWRMRFEWDEPSVSLKVNVATSYQLQDDMSISSSAGRDGIKSPVFREPGELCDVYQTPSIGRGSTLQINRAKQQWFRKPQIEDMEALTYPMSYKLTVSDHGIAMFLFDQAAVDQDDDYAWLVVQRHVNQTTGEPEFSDKSPLHCVYSPSKRAIDVASLSPYYNTNDVADLSKPEPIFGALGGVFKTEAPTIYVNNSASFFNGRINAVDFNGYGYASGSPTLTGNNEISQESVKKDVFRGITGTSTTPSTSLWSETSWTLNIDTSGVGTVVDEEVGAVSTDPALPRTERFPDFIVGKYVHISDQATPATVNAITDHAASWGGRIKSWNKNSGELVISSTDSIDNILINAGTPIDYSASDPKLYVWQGNSTSGNVTDGTFVADATRLDIQNPPLLIGDAPASMAGRLTSNPEKNLSGSKASITDLAITGFNSLPRRRNTSIALAASNSPGAIVQQPKQLQVSTSNTDSLGVVTTTVSDYPALLRSTSLTGSQLSLATPAAASYIISTDTAAQFSENVVWPTNILERMSTFKSSSATGEGLPSAIENISITDYKSGDAALLDILYIAQPENSEKVMESMVVALDDIEVPRDSSAYILTYDEWTRRGDPTTVPRFLESLDAAGVTNLGPNFKIPVLDNSIVPNFNVLKGGMDPDATNANQITISTNNASTGKKFFSEWINIVELDAVAGVETVAYVAPVAADPSATPPVEEVVEVLAVAGVVEVVEYKRPVWDFTTSLLVKTEAAPELNSKLPGDVIWKDNSTRNAFMYDFYNKSLYFKSAPRAGAAFSIQMINYQTSNPSQGTYIISQPEDRNFPETNMNDVKAINRFIVREKDVMKPWDYHVSATMHEIDSHAIINPHEQLAITQDRNFVFSFPTQLTTQRFYYPESELDLICVSSADFSTQAGYVEINKYTDSDGKNDGAATTSTAAISVLSNADPDKSITGSIAESTFSGSNVNEVFAYGGHTSPDGKVYIWRKNARKYEGMVSTLPNGNGMRIFMQVTGSSIRHSDVDPATNPSAG